MRPVHIWLLVRDQPETGTSKRGLMVISIATTTTSFKPSTPSLSQKPDWQSGIVSQPAKEPHLRATSPCMSPDPMSQQEQCQRLNQRRLSELVNLWLTTSFKSR